MLTISSPSRRCPPWRGALTNDKVITNLNFFNATAKNFPANTLVLNQR